MLTWQLPGWELALYPVGINPGTGSGGYPTSFPLRHTLAAGALWAVYLSIILSASLVSFTLASALNSLSYFSSFGTPGIGLIGVLGLIGGSPIESGTVSWHIATPLSPPRAGSDTLNVQLISTVEATPNH